MRKIPYLLTPLILVALLSTTFAQEDGFKAVEERIVEFTLDNGLKFLVLPRREAPVVSFVTYADVGSADDPKGQTGIAHLFEHMAFKGTPTIGSKDFKKEKAAIQKVDRAYAKLKGERLKGEKADAEQLKVLEEEFEAAQEVAAQYLERNEFLTVIERAGGVGLNAGTGNDMTVYFYSLPSNKIELWFSLESDRFLNPVLREFYTERDVVMEERRLRIESQPIGKLVEEFLSVAYKAHPYGVSGLGHMSDLQNITREQAEEFFQEYYVPSNLTIAVVGDVDAGEVQRLAKTYFERIPGGPKRLPISTTEPPQRGQRRFAIEEQSQRIIVIGYHKESITHKDNAVFDAISDILSAGRTSRLYRSLVRDKKVATIAGGFSGFPGEKYPNLFLFFAFPAPGHTNEECEKAIDEEIERLKTELVDEGTLKKAKTRARANLVRQLNSNQGMASQLATYEMLTGSWRDLFQQLDKVNAVTAEDIKRVANEYFTIKNRTVGMIEPASK
ncbi:MAG: pitrilysin family protein [Bacteroidota bacterium]